MADNVPKQYISARRKAQVARLPDNHNWVRASERVAYRDVGVRAMQEQLPNGENI